MTTNNKREFNKEVDTKGCKMIVSLRDSKIGGQKIQNLKCLH